LRCAQIGESIFAVKGILTESRHHALIDLFSQHFIIAEGSGLITVKVPVDKSYKLLYTENYVFQDID
jgi:hypothetical protein